MICFVQAYRDLRLAQRLLKGCKIRQKLTAAAVVVSMDIALVRGDLPGGQSE